MAQGTTGVITATDQQQQWGAAVDFGQMLGANANGTFIATNGQEAFLLCASPGHSLTHVIPLTGGAMPWTVRQIADTDLGQQYLSGYGQANAGATGTTGSQENNRYTSTAGA